MGDRHAALSHAGSPIILADALAGFDFDKLRQRSRAETVGELRLTVAVLTDAIHGACKRGAHERLRAVQDREWVERTDHDTFGFDWCCDELGIDPEWGRSGILRYIDAMRAAERSTQGGPSRSRVETKVRPRDKDCRRQASAKRRMLTHHR